VKHVQEELESPYTVEKCDYMDGCDCEIVEVIPEKARGMLFDNVYIYDANSLLEIGERSIIIV
jgi:hypothetical protein